MKLYQLAYNVQVYGEHAGWRLVVSDELFNSESKRRRFGEALDVLAEKR
jgi:hypothetical protein